MARDREYASLFPEGLDNEPLHYCDTPEQIDFCLNHCPYKKPVCGACTEVMRVKTARKRKTKEELQALRERAAALRGQGLSHEAIAEAVGTSPTTVGRWLRKLREEGRRC